jgi:hypothetical protein
VRDPRSGTCATPAAAPALPPPRAPHLSPTIVSCSALNILLYSVIFFAGIRATAFAAIALNEGGTGAGRSHGALSQCGLLLLLLVLVLRSRGLLVQALLLQQVISAPHNRAQWRRRGGSGVVYRRLLVLVSWDSRARQTAGAVCLFLASAYVSIRQHTSAYVGIRVAELRALCFFLA